LKDEKFIKETLRVRTGENSLGLKVTKPNQELIIWEVSQEVVNQQKLNH
jgi:hypothetical protein